jgi:hypothetical protein
MSSAGNNAGQGEPPVRPEGVRPMIVVCVEEKYERG